MQDLDCMLLHKRNCDLATGADLAACALSRGSTWVVRAVRPRVNDSIDGRVQLPCAALPQERTTPCHLTGAECPAQPSCGWQCSATMALRALPCRARSLRLLSQDHATAHPNNKSQPIIDVA